MQKVGLLQWGDTKDRRARRISGVENVSYTGICVFEGKKGPVVGLEVVLFDELVDACPAFVGRTAADVHEQDIENEIEHTEIGKLTGLDHSVYEVEQSMCGLFEMNVGTDGALRASQLQDFAEDIEQIPAAQRCVGSDGGVSADIFGVVRVKSPKIYELIFDVAKEAFKRIGGISLDFEASTLIGFDSSFHTSQNQFFFPTKHLIEGAFRDAKCTGNVVHGHLSHPLRLEKLSGAVNHLEAPAFVALFVKFSIHTVVVVHTLPDRIPSGSCVFKKRIHGEFTTFFG